MTRASSERTPRLQWALDALRELHAQALRSAGPGAFRDEAGERFLARFERLLESLAKVGPDYEYEGREMLNALPAQYPELWDSLDRRLLWFFGGDCLHYLSDEEIDAFMRDEDAED